MSFHSNSIRNTRTAGKICRSTFIVSLKRRPLAQKHRALSCRNPRQDKARYKPGILAYCNQSTTCNCQLERTVSHCTACNCQLDSTVSIAWRVTANWTVL